MSDNIINLVLAKTGNSGGVKDISLFIVPKYLMDKDGNKGRRNDITLMGMNNEQCRFLFLSQYL